MYIYFFLSGLINFVASVFLGAFVFRRAEDKKVGKMFAIFCFFVAFWSFGYMFWPLSGSKESVLFWFQFSHIGASFISVAFLHFIITWLKKKSIFYKFVVSLAYASSLFFASQTFFPQFILDIVPKFSMEYWPVPGYLYYFYLIHFFGFFLFSIILLLVEHYKEGFSPKRVQMRLVLLGILLAFFGGSTNYFLWFDINIPPFGNVLVCSYVILTAFAIIKYQLSSIKLFLAQFLTVSIWILVLAQLFFAKSISNYVLVFLTLFIAVIFGIFLIKSVKSEIQKKEELKKMSDELARKDDELRKLDNAKSEFISIASHQLRTPLTAIKGFISLLLEGSYGELKKEHADVLNKIYLSNERLIRLVEDLLNISRIESGRVEYKYNKVDLKKVCEEVIDTFTIRAKDKGLHLELEDKEKEISKIYTDKEKIREVISNLIDNAIKYTPGGKVTVRAYRKRDFLRVEVIDTGIGIPKGEAKYLFNKFSRGKDTNRLNTSGTGLGLYVGRSMIESLGGKIWAESDGEGKGSKFVVELPAKTRIYE